MIDTVILLIPTHEFEVLKHDSFNPSAKGLFIPPYYPLSMGMFKCVQNPTKKDKEAGIYKPRLTLTKRMRQGGFSIALKIEFSAPKLLFGNNFDELKESDFGSIVDVLHKRLEEMHIRTSKDALYNADVVGIHYGKNIVFTDLTTSSLIINTLAKLDVSKRLDAGNTDYRNNGQSIRYHTNAYELVFYDKIKDLQQGNISERRSLEVDNYIQGDLFKQKAFKKRLEVLRVELRFNGKRKLKATMQKIGINPKSTQFCHLFNKEVARRMLMHFWGVVIASSLNIVLLAENKPSVLLSKLLCIGIKEAKALQILGALLVINENGQGIRGLKQVLSATGNTYKRLSNELKEIDLSDNYLYSCFEKIKTTINDLSPVRMVDYEELM